VFVSQLAECAVPHELRDAVGRRVMRIDALR
jgi:hypothetical protein